MQPNLPTHTSPACTLVWCMYTLTGQHGRSKGNGDRYRPAGCKFRARNCSWAHPFSNTAVCVYTQRKIVMHQFNRFFMVLRRRRPHMPAASFLDTPLALVQQRMSTAATHPSLCALLRRWMHLWVSAPRRLGVRFVVERRSLQKGGWSVGSKLEITKKHHGFVQGKPKHR